MGACDCIITKVSWFYNGDASYFLSFLIQGLKFELISLIFSLVGRTNRRGQALLLKH